MWIKLLETPAGFPVTYTSTRGSEITGLNSYGLAWVRRSCLSIWPCLLCTSSLDCPPSVLNPSLHCCPSALGWVTLTRVECIPTLSTCDRWKLGPFHVLTCHRCFLLDEESLKILGLFCNHCWKAMLMGTSLTLLTLARKHSILHHELDGGISLTLLTLARKHSILHHALWSSTVLVTFFTNQRSPLYSCLVNTFHNELVLGLCALIRPYCFSFLACWCDKIILIDFLLPILPFTPGMPHFVWSIIYHILLGSVC